MTERFKTVEIDLAELEKLASMQCTDEEIAHWFNVSTRTIERKRKSPAFAETIARGKSKGKISLRRSQLKLVEQGNPAMAIWLGKQYLGQTDEVRHEVNIAAHLSVIMPRAVETIRIPGAGAARPLLEAGESEEIAEIELGNCETVSKSG
jgi:hypothetical protein